MLAPDPSAYWARSVNKGVLELLCEKYAALERLSRGEATRDHFQRVAARWPGALREAELVGPEGCATRARAAQQAVASAVEPASAFRARGQAALPLWADLHAMLRDQRRFRAAGGRSDDMPGFCAQAEWDSWQDVSTLVRVAGDRVRARQAYLWLAACCGLDLPALNLILFDRAGHWDRRADDPSGMG